MDERTSEANPHTPQVRQLQTRVTELQQVVADMEAERDRLRRGRRRQLLFIGAAVSLLVHICLMIYLNTIHRMGPPQAGPEPVSFEFAIVQEEELTWMEDSDLQDLLPEALSELADQPPQDPAAKLDTPVPSAQLDIASVGALPTLGSSGNAADGVAGLSGAGAGTSFFGVSSKGTRFAYIVDVSGSMREERKMLVAMRELQRSIEQLPDYAQFFIVLFSNGHRVPPMQEGWTRARPSTVRHFKRWLDDLDPGGSTKPRTAFLTVFSLEQRPDVIFFLTDGEIQSFTAEEAAEMNGRGKRIVINTIAFGDPSSQELLKRMADDSGGTYRFVPSGSR